MINRQFFWNLTAIGFRHKPHISKSEAVVFSRDRKDTHVVCRLRRQGHPAVHGEATALTDSVRSLVYILTPGLPHS